MSEIERLREAIAKLLPFAIHAQAATWKVNNEWSMNFSIAIEGVRAALAATPPGAERGENLADAVEPAPWAKDALFVLTTHGDGEGALLARGWQALCEAVVDAHYFQPNSAQRAEVLDRLTAWDDWEHSAGGPFFLVLDYEDGRVTITRITEGCSPPASEGEK